MAMTEKVPGGPLPVAADEIRREAEMGKASRMAGQMTAPNDMKNNFPVVPVAPDKYDDLFNIKKQFATEANNTAWMVPFDGQDASWVARQRDKAEKAEYDEWLYRKYDLSDLPTAAMIQQIAPEIWERREEYLNYQMSLVDRYAKTRLYGPRSEADIKLEWLVETGRVKLPDYNLWDPVGPDNAKRAGDYWTAYTAGSWSPLQWVYGAIIPQDPASGSSDIRPRETNIGQVGSNLNLAGVPQPARQIYGANPVARQQNEADEAFEARGRRQLQNPIRGNMGWAAI